MLRGTSLVIFLLLLISVAFGGAAAAQSGADRPVAELNGEMILQDEIDKGIAVQLGKLQEQIYNLRRQRLDTAIRERLLAQEADRRGVSVPKLMDTEVTSKIGVVSEEEVERSFQATRGRQKGDIDETAARDQIRSQLQSQRIAAQREAFIQSLRKAAKVAIRLEPPPVVRVNVSTDRAPVRGAVAAPVTIVEFSDFHCPFCKRVLPTLKQVEEKYGEKVKLVFRNYPLDQLHPGARRAHEAASCAHEQGKFWAYHDIVFEKSPGSSGDNLQAYAESVGLDLTRFDTCLRSGTPKAVVQKDVDEGGRLGINGTPTFFINGQLVSGAVPLETFVRLIDAELERTQ
jgi:protein-disulfide isomerase